MTCRTILMLSALALMVGCDQPPDSPADQPRPPQEPAMEFNDARELNLEQSVAAARTNLAAKLEIPEDMIRVETSRRVTWSDGALGCPEPDMMYTQALVEGYYILLSADGQEHAYHAGRDGRPFACPSDRSKPPPDDLHYE